MFGIMSCELAVFIVFLIAFSISSTTDIKTRKIPVWLFPAAMLISLMLQIIDGSFEWHLSLIGLVVFFGVFFFCALFGKGGGGDAIMLGSVGAVFYVLDTALIVLAASFIYCCFAIIRTVIKKESFWKLKKVQYPYAPFVSIGFVIVEVIRLLGGS